ncbi:LisH [Teratosphaeria destructans]|uniref:LisH n=1 Tax=Teratosphaeria destructans TaxID=418781 RepID=A0A9W7SR69_9PEZI|nr:LisH [Teratosphaeria destructans]
MAAGALHSDHINYLIYRYLQEHGHENTAIAFHRDWYRPREYRDPENLPFAPIVQRHELITVVQKGLLFDELSCRGRDRGQRKFRWNGVSPRDRLDERDGEAVEGSREVNGAHATGSRPSSRGRRKGKAVSGPVSDEFPTPAPKRQRTSEGSGGVHVNGEAMDVDPSAVSPSAIEGEEDGEGASTAVGSDVEVMEVPERYDSMDVVNVATQTEVKVAPKTSTMYWKLDKPDAVVLHSQWNPSAESSDVNTLLTVGEGLCRVYRLSETTEDERHVEHHDDPNIGPKAVITASDWHPDGQSAVYAVDSIRKLDEEAEEGVQHLLHHRKGHGSTVMGPGPPLLDPPGIILYLAPSDAEGANERSAELVGWRIFESEVQDACWTAADMFVVCREDHPLMAAHLDPVSASNGDAELDASTVMRQGLVEHEMNVAMSSSRGDKVRYDSHLGALVVTANADGTLITLPLSVERTSEAMTLKLEDCDRTTLPGTLTALAFEPTMVRDAHGKASDGDKGNDRRLLAAAFGEGFTTIYRISHAADHAVHLEVLHRLNLDDAAPALALAWSPDGAQLAVSSTSTIHIWRREELSERKNGLVKRPWITWRADSAALGNGGMDGERRDDADGVLEPSLSWSADGERLAFAVEKQIAVIWFRPSLRAGAQSDAHDEEPIQANGGGEAEAGSSP